MFKHIKLHGAWFESRSGKILPAIKFYVARGDIWNEQASFNPFPDKAEVERQKKLWKIKTSLFVETYTALLIHFVKMCKNRDTLA
jgi:hypothetical protein